METEDYLREFSSENMIHETRLERNAQKEDNNKKKKKKIIIISIVSALLIIGLIITIILIKTKDKPVIESAWGEVYYEYLNDADNLEKAGLTSDMEDAKINFYDAKGVKNPVMVISYDKNDNDYANIYYINKKKVKSIIYKEPIDINLLYNIEKDEYGYYIKTDNENEEIYKGISDVIKNKIAKTDDKVLEYKFKDDEKDFVTDIQGNEISLTKFDQTFINIELEEDGINYDIDLDEEELKEAINDTISIYKKIDKAITKSIKNEEKEKKELLEKKKEDMKKAKEEVEKKAAEEKAKEEAAKKGIKVGSYTLKYGTYKGEADGPNKDEILVLNEDGTCKYAGEACTYTVGSHDFTQDGTPHVYDCLVINGKYTYYLYPYNSTTVGDGDINLFIFSN